MQSNNLVDQDMERIFFRHSLLIGLTSFFFYVLVSYGPLGLFINLILWLIHGAINRYGFLYAFPYLQSGDKSGFNVIISVSTILSFIVHWFAYFLVLIPASSLVSGALVLSLPPSIFALLVAALWHYRLYRKYSQKRKQKNMLEDVLSTKNNLTTEIVDNEEMSIYISNSEDADMNTKSKLHD